MGSVYRGLGSYSNSCASYSEIVTSDFDIFRTAKVLIHEHGDAAVLEAAMRADAVLEKGDLAVC